MDQEPIIIKLPQFKPLPLPHDFKIITITQISDYVPNSIQNGKDNEMLYAAESNISLDSIPQSIEYPPSISSQSSLKTHKTSQLSESSTQPSQLTRPSQLDQQLSISECDDPQFFSQPFETYHTFSRSEIDSTHFEKDKQKFTQPLHPKPPRNKNSFHLSHLYHDSNLSPRNIVQTNNNVNSLQYLESESQQINEYTDYPSTSDFLSFSQSRNNFHLSYLYHDSNLSSQVSSSSIYRSSPRNTLQTNNNVNSLRYLESESQPIDEYTDYPSTSQSDFVSFSQPAQIVSQLPPFHHSQPNFQPDFQLVSQPSNCISKVDSPYPIDNCYEVSTSSSQPIEQYNNSCFFAHASSTTAKHSTPQSNRNPHLFHSQPNPFSSSQLSNRDRKPFTFHSNSQPAYTHPPPDQPTDIYQPLESTELHLSQPHQQSPPIPDDFVIFLV